MQSTTVAFRPFNIICPIRLAEKYRDFAVLWAYLQDATLFEGMDEGQIITTVTHSQFGEMKIMSLRMAERYLPWDVNVWIQVPLAVSEEKYLLFQESIQENKVYFFTPRPLE